MMCNGPRPPADQFPPGWAPNVWRNLQHVCVVAGCGCLEGRIDCGAFSVRSPRTFRRAMTQFCVNGCECVEIFTPREEIEAILKIDALLGENRQLTWGRAGPRLSDQDSPPGILPGLGGTDPTRVVTRRSQYPSYVSPEDTASDLHPHFVTSLTRLRYTRACNVTAPDRRRPLYPKAGIQLSLTTSNKSACWRDVSAPAIKSSVASLFWHLKLFVALWVGSAPRRAGVRPSLT